MNTLAILPSINTQPFAHRGALAQANRVKSPLSSHDGPSHPSSQAVYLMDAHSKQTAKEVLRNTTTTSKGTTTGTPKYSDNIQKKKNAQVVIQVLEPGLVVVRNFLNDTECQRVAQQALDMGHEGFYTTDSDGQRQLNTGEHRGRIYDAATAFPPNLVDTCNQVVQQARDADTSMPSMTCTHILLNMYTTSQGLVWHRDIYENDGRSDHPVVNLCVGAACTFGYKHQEADPERTIRLQSGDVLLFGGRCRWMLHAVLEVHLDDCPAWMTMRTNEPPCRFSFTFRDSPEVLGRENEFKYFRVSEHLVGQEDFEVPEKPEDYRGLPSHETQVADRKNSP